MQPTRYLHVAISLLSVGAAAVVLEAVVVVRFKLLGHCVVAVAPVNTVNTRNKHLSGNVGRTF